MRLCVWYGVAMISRLLNYCSFLQNIVALMNVDIQFYDIQSTFSFVAQLLSHMQTHQCVYACMYRCTDMYVFVCKIYIHMYRYACICVLNI